MLELVRLVNPQKLLFIAFDGVAPRAKINQSRDRRFRSGVEDIEFFEKLAQDIGITTKYLIAYSDKTSKSTPFHQEQIFCSTSAPPFAPRSWSSWTLSGKHWMFFIQTAAFLERGSIRSWISFVLANKLAYSTILPLTASILQTLMSSCWLLLSMSRIYASLKRILQSSRPWTGLLHLPSESLVLLSSSWSSLIYWDSIWNVSLRRRWR